MGFLYMCLSIQMPFSAIKTLPCARDRVTCMPRCNPDSISVTKYCTFIVCNLQLCLSGPKYAGLGNGTGIGGCSNSAKKNFLKNTPILREIAID